ncbi:predicted protein [Plenodomus lingam JN3]|uniref:Uncharacterized protein n=1 Tax=Leptosphaeria maculans (strain JN3 / isolate v23.1.3 / race Av1-4-5-6-7-8) TaxID=985895 RepID=E5A6Q5_LEPMJ|nr:predicted protein [Plenodomus lingam JN3]CBX99300.1 predicted protein [Plenodomus lingam JN3]
MDERVRLRVKGHDYKQRQAGFPSVMRLYEPAVSTKGKVRPVKPSAPVSRCEVLCHVELWVFRVETSYIAFTPTDLLDYETFRIEGNSSAPPTRRTITDPKVGDDTLLEGC